MPLETRTRTTVPWAGTSCVDRKINPTVAAMIAAAIERNFIGRLYQISLKNHPPNVRKIRLRGCEQITFNAETAEAAEKKCLKISLRALRALRSNVAFFHRLLSRWMGGLYSAIISCGPPWRRVDDR